MRRCGHFRRFCECSLVCGVSSQGGGSDAERTKKKKRGDRYSVQTSLIVAALKKMLPIGLNMCSPADQELINLAKIRYSLVASHAAAAAAVKLLSLTVARNETKHLCCRETLMKRCESSCRTTFICKARYHNSCALEMITKIQWSYDKQSYGSVLHSLNNKTFVNLSRNHEMRKSATLAAASVRRTTVPDSLLSHYQTRLDWISNA